MCLGVSGQTPPCCPHSPVGELGRVERPSGRRENMQELSPCLETPGYRRPPRRGAGALDFTSSVQRSRSRSQSSRITSSSLSLPSASSFPPVLCLSKGQGLAEGQGDICKHSAAPSSEGLSHPRVLLPWRGLVGAVSRILCKHPSRGEEQG